MSFYNSNGIKIKYKPTKVIVRGKDKKKSKKTKKPLFKGFSSKEKSFAKKVDKTAYSIGRSLFKWKNQY